VEQPGRIRVVQHGVLLGTPFLTSQAACCTGRGRPAECRVPPLSATNHFFYVDYTRRNAAGDTVYTMIERYTVSADSNVADSATTS